MAKPIMQFAPIFTLVVLLPAAALANACQKGQYLKEGKCYPCPANTYMPEPDHTFKSCFPCEQLSGNEDSHAAVLKPCTSHSPTIFGCQEGYFRNSNQLTFESVCCPEPNMAVENTDQGPRCYHPSDSVWITGYLRTSMAKSMKILAAFFPFVVVLPNAALEIACQKGQYFREGKCHPCPANTYMPETNHHFTSCFTCVLMSGNEAAHATVLQPCKSDSPTIFGCQEGYYRKSQQLTSEENCSPCGTCPGQYVRSLCDFLHDTVCSPEPHMAVEDTNQDPRRYHPSDSATTSGKNEHSEQKKKKKIEDEL